MTNKFSGADPALLRRNTRAYLDRIERSDWRGVVAVRYENGVPVHIRAEQSILPNNLPPMENPPNETRKS
jgi:hypothetical protein